MKLTEVKLKDVTINNRGYYGIGASAVDYDKNKYTYLRITDINDDGTLNRTGLMSVDDEKACEFLLKENDIVFARTGASTGRNYFYDGEINNMVFAGFLIKFSLDEEKVNPRFIKYYCLSQTYKNWIDSSLTGSTRPNINEKQLSEMPILLPDREYQDSVVKILDSITEKISINNKMNDNLQDLIREYYKETFKQETNLVKVKDVVEFSQGVQVPIENQYEDLQDNLIRFIRIVDLTQGGENNIRYIENKNRGLVNYDDIFMIRYGSPGILGWNYKGIIANNLFKIMPKNNDITKNYLYCYFNNDEIQSYIKQNATSSTMPAINFSLLYDRLIAIPEKEKLMKFDKFVEEIRLKELEIIKENNILSNIRDTLLPKLMNGEVDLDKIEI